ncbi:aldose epimerase [Herbiconiux sp. CPCC 205763]|uniref:Aldose epimerase n=1 Tax=Herbiconiux aconitum TaxID=2970913 RepID=A0ABT2GVW3_9MICO|nr:aldose epimerase [Herbiconiux aconitum]MCS5720350.1 aldose epimerase [Herbiconiux aconitum]
MIADAVLAGLPLVRLTDGTGRVLAAVSPRAASLRSLTVRGLDIVEPFVTEPDAPGMAGATLVPWPNRVEDAIWWHNGHRHELAMTEPELGHANHGLLAGDDFAVLSRDETSATLGAEIRQPQGYPFDLDVAVGYVVTDSGITVTTSVENRGTEPAPVALGAHPYLRIGSASIDELVVSVQATHAYRLDDRHIPRERFAVAGTPWDLTVPRRIADSPAHATFEQESAAGVLVHSLHEPNGDRVELWADDDYRFTQLYIARELPSDTGPRLAVAIEPMTAPPNALRTGEGLRWLAPDERWCTSWGVRLAT